jgi:Na+/melibiose symporter-like transporter
MKKNYFKLKKEQLKNLTSNFNKKAFFNFLGSIIIYMVFGSLYTWSNINIYLVSYLKQYNSPNIEIVDGYFIMPIVLVIADCSNYFGTKIEEKLEYKKCLLLSLLLACGSHFILLFTTRLAIIYILMIIFGIGIGFSFIGITKNS